MEKVAKGFYLGFFCCFVLSCATAAFNYKYYGMNLAQYKDGKLLGPEPKDDLPFERCAPTEADKGPCVVMFREDFFNMKEAYLRNEQALLDCQGN